MNQTSGLVTVEKFKSVTILSINRPDKQNAMNEALLQELAAHLTQFESDVDARVVVLHGIGGNFSIGYDIDELKEKCQLNQDAIRSSLFVSSISLENCRWQCCAEFLSINFIDSIFSYHFGVKPANHLCVA